MGSGFDKNIKACLKCDPIFFFKEKLFKNKYNKDLMSLFII